MTLPTLIWHIGLHKTGTSAIQAMLYRHRESLKSMGVLYPTSICWTDRSHHKLLLSIWNDDDYTQLMDNFISEVNTATPKAVILSSELSANLIHHPNKITSLLDILKLYFNPINVVVYVRRPDRLIDSVFKQWCKDPAVALRQPPAEFVESQAKSQLRFLSLIDAWAKVVGHNNIILRSYERNKQDIVQSFLDACQIPLKITDEELNTNINPSLDGVSLILRHFTNQLTSNKDHNKKLLHVLLNEFPHNNTITIFSRQGRGRLLSLLADENEMLFKKYSSSTEQFDMNTEEDEKLEKFRLPHGHELFSLLEKISKNDKKLACLLLNNTINRSINVDLLKY